MAITAETRLIEIALAAATAVFSASVAPLLRGLGAVGRPGVRQCTQTTRSGVKARARTSVKRP